MSQVNNPAPNPLTRRRSQRVLMQVHVRIQGTDPQGKSFEEQAVTLAVNAHGALVSLKHRLTTGSKVNMRHNMTEEEQECHIVHLGPIRDGKTEVGLEFSVPRPAFWRVAFPPEDWSARSPEARTALHTRLVDK
jgi:PilZ domain-containing protein